MDKITIKVYAKINLSLNVFEVNNGLHNLDSVVTSIDIYDKIILRKRSDNQIKFKCKKLCFNNTATKACQMFMKRFNTGGVDISIKKKIPFMCGVGGSSADASAVLVGMSKLFEINENLNELALNIGSDVPYMLSGGFARISGHGENVDFFDSSTFKVLLIIPDGGVSTKECFLKFDMVGCEKEANNDQLIEDLTKLRLSRVPNNCINMLQKAACVLNKNVDEVFNALNSFEVKPQGKFLTGSGSGIVVIDENISKLKKIQKFLKSKKIKSVIVKTLNKGIEF